MLIFAFRPSVVRRTNTPVLDAYFCLPDTPREITYIMSGFRECFSAEVYRVTVRSFTDLEGEKMVRDTGFEPPPAALKRSSCGLGLREALRGRGVTLLHTKPRL
jgi:hypothetical protein